MREPAAPTREPVAEALDEIERRYPTARGPALRIAGDMPVALDRPATRDVRARRPNVLGALRQSHALQRLGRVLSLLALDLGAIWAAIFTAIAFKELVRGDFVLDRVSGQAW